MHAHLACARPTWCTAAVLYCCNIRTNDINPLFVVRDEEEPDPQSWYTVKLLYTSCMLSFLLKTACALLLQSTAVHQTLVDILAPSTGHQGLREVGQDESETTAVRQFSRSSTSHTCTIYTKHHPAVIYIYMYICIWIRLQIDCCSTFSLRQSTHNKQQ